MNKNIRKLSTMGCGIIAVLIVTFGCATKPKGPIDSLGGAKELVITQVYKGKLGKRAMFASPELKKSGVMIGTWPTPERVKVEEDSWFFFIDEQPGANWEHPAKLVLVEKESRKVRSIAISTPIPEITKMQAMNPIAQAQFKVIKKNIDSIRDIVVDSPIKILKREKYAVLVSGGINAGANHSRYWNDLASIYIALKDKYNYTDSEIIVLYANGTHNPNEDLDGDGSNDVDYAATKSNLTTVMQHVENHITSDGKFFFYSTNHGGHEGGHDATLYLWGETITDDEFGALTKDIKSKNAIYVMEQCFSGGMMDDILAQQTYPCTNPKVCVMTAANHEEFSWSADTEGDYDEYIYHWTAAVYGKIPGGSVVNADTNNDGIVSMKEAHEYAKTNDSRNEHPMIGSCIVDACDTSLFVGLTFKEDCVGFNPNTTAVQQINGSWKVVDGNHWLFDFKNNAAEANQTLKIIKHYSMNKSCFIGRPDPSFQYMLKSSISPTGAVGGEDCVSFNPATTTVQQINGNWKITDGSHWMFDFGTNKSEAYQSLEIIKNYGFNHSCFIGRPGASFQYLRK